MNPSQSTLDPAGPGAAAIAEMWWVLLAICTVVFLVVMAALVVALARSPEGRGRSLAAGREPGVERRRVAWVLVAGAGIPAVILVGIFFYTMVVLDRIAPSDPGADLTIEVTGKQYWWEVRYPDGAGRASPAVVTANEIHIPVGRRVRLVLESDDVIHSFWVPRLHGKTDMIPGRVTEGWLMADEPGVYRGQCAEYCGAQHTWMALLVVAQPEDEFRRWLQHQARPAPAPAAEPEPAPDGGEREVEPGDHVGPPVPDTLRERGMARAARVRRGREVFFAPENRCAGCHVIRGENDRGDRVTAAGRLAPAAAPGEPPGRTAEGPDLTHVASRRTLAAGLLPNSRGSLGGWVANPQVLKPGSLMPRVPLEPGDLNALLDYLMTLQ